MVDAPSLESILSAYYQAKMMGRGKAQDAFTAFDNAVGADPTFADAARTKLAEFKKVNAGGQKCVISATNAEFLIQALSH